MFTIPSEPVARFRLLAIWFAIALTLGNALLMPASPDIPLAYRIVGAGAGLLLAAWWVWGYRHGGFPVSGWLVDVVGLTVVAAASPLPLRAIGIFYAGVQIRALYVSQRQFVLMALTCGVARIASVSFAPTPLPYGPLSATVLIQVIGLTVVGVMAHMFATASMRQTEAEHALKASDERYRLVASVTRDAFYDWNVVKGTLEWTESLRQVFGYAPNELSQAANWIELVHPDDRVAYEAGVQAFIAERRGTADSLRCRIRRADGTYAYTLGNAVMQHGLDGTPARIVGSVRDVTAEHQLEEQFRQSQKMEAVGQLAGGVAHDFNNLLTVIGGHVFMVEQHMASNDVATRHLSGITSAAERAATLTKQLLAFSRKQILKPSVLNLNVVVDEVTALIQPLIGEHIRLGTQLDPFLAPVLADSGQLGHVLVNLALNARDAMTRGGTITIETTNTRLEPGSEETLASGLTPGAFVRLTVRDTGVGMDAATLARAFEPFFTTKPPGRGTGLGLATAYGIVKQSFGDIRADSKPGAGATFTILLPAVDQIAEERGDRTSATIRDESAGDQPRSILLVEDDDGVREFARSVLLDAGFNVHVASNGIEGLTVARRPETAIDLVVTDVVMPEMGGREMVEHLRRRRPDLRVLFMSGYTDDARTLGELRASTVTLLAKPFTARALAHAVRNV